MGCEVVLRVTLKSTNPSGGGAGTSLQSSSAFILLTSSHDQKVTGVIVIFCSQNLFSLILHIYTIFEQNYM